MYINNTPTEKTTKHIVKDVQTSLSYFYISTRAGELIGMKKELFGGHTPIVGDVISIKEAECGILDTIKVNQKIIYTNEAYSNLPQFLKNEINNAWRMGPNNQHFNAKEVMFICAEGMKIAQSIKTATGLIDYVKKANDEGCGYTPTEHQMQQIPTLSKNHTPETFRLACNAAMAIIQERQKDILRTQQSINYSR